MRIVASLLSCALLGIPLIAACGVAEIPGTPSSQLATPEKTTGSVNTKAKDGKCEPGSEPVKAEKVDPAKLTPCECKAGGKARCAPKDRLPDSLVARLADCDSGAGSCVPDTVLASGGAPLKECKVGTDEGRCLSMCIPQVEANLNVLQRGDTCLADERCIPCLDPLTQKPTGICAIESIEEGSQTCRAVGTAAAGSAIGAKTGETVSCPFDPKTATPGDPNLFPACGTGGRCLKNSLVPADIAKRLGSCAAEGGEPGLCIPEVYVVEKGKHLPGVCSSFAGIEGRCFSTVFQDVQEQQDILQQDACKPDERCVPCQNPATGKDTGACSTVSCDAPKKPPTTLPDCCNRAGATRGKCIPKKDIPTAYQSRLKRFECEADALCAPSDQINTDAVTAPCSADGDPGVCVSDCINIGFFEGLIGDIGPSLQCRSDQNCIPCAGPLGRPTGAPGCPK